jgi:hypothetical protein
MTLQSGSHKINQRHSIDQQLPANTQIALFARALHASNLSWDRLKSRLTDRNRRANPQARTVCISFVTGRPRTPAPNSDRKQHGTHPQRMIGVAACTKLYIIPIQRADPHDSHLPTISQLSLFNGDSLRDTPQAPSIT